MKIRTLIVAAGLAAVAFSAPRAQESAPTLVQVQNLGYAVERVAVQAGVAVFTVSEAKQGGADLNGDGDATDRVLFVHDDVTGVTTNLGLQVGLLWVVGTHHVAVFVPEDGLGDLNRDGDTLDEVVHVLDLATLQVANTGLASLEIPLFPLFQCVQAGDGFLTIRVDEKYQGAKDLNRDGDANDLVLHVYDLESGAVTNLGLDAHVKYPSHVSGGRIAFSVSESGQGGFDLNRDGDADDVVLHVHDLEQGTTTNLGLAAQDCLFLPDHLVFLVDEADQGLTDFTGDGDRLDDVIFVASLATGTSTSLGFASGVWDLAPASDTFLFLVSEAEQGGTDLNGDGDLGDHVLFHHDPSAGATTNLQLCVNALMLPEFLRADGIRVVMSLSEAHSAAADLNGDGDALDEVVHVFDGASKILTNHQLAGVAVPRGHRLATTVYEGMQGHSDLNGDGDTSDAVLHVRDLGTGMTVNTGIAVPAGSPEGDSLFGARELSMGQDLNGDGDLDDIVIHAFELYSETSVNLGLAGLVAAYDEPLQAVIVGEAGQGQMDLNGDGDALDGVLHLVRPLYQFGLSSDVDTLSIAAGGTQALTLDAGSAHAGELYLLLGSLAGTKPGLAHLSFTLPLNPDAYFWLTLSSPGPTLSGSLGTLDGWGEGEALFALPPASFPPLVGQVAHHAFVAIDTAIPAVTLVSDPVPLAFLP
jgi:hypothetical protein